jgi:ferric-dicitrate binding protein FerR (iron transport regulator)
MLPNPDWSALELDSLDVALLWRYWDGLATTTERATLENWFNAKPGRRAWCAQLRRGLVVGTGESLSPQEVERRAARVLEAAGVTTSQKGADQTGISVPALEPTSMPAAARTLAPRAKTLSVQPPNRITDSASNQTLRRTMGGVAIAFAALASMVIGRFIPLPKWHERAPAQIAYVTGNGERAKVELPDGTHVVLNVASRLEVPANFGKQQRSLRLVGQAYFQVAHTDGTPFIVQAGRTETKVLGTAFSVRAYQPSNVQVAVREGKVAVDNAVLGAADIASIVSNSPVVIARHQNLDAAQGFVAGHLVLQQTQLRNVIPDLDRWYDVDLRLSDPALGNLPIDLILMDGSVGDLVELLKNLYNLRVVREGRMLTLYPH